MTKTKRHYTPSAKQNALNELYLAISNYTNLVEAGNKDAIAGLIRLSFSRGASVQEVVDTCKFSRTSVYKIINERS